MTFIRGSEQHDKLSPIRLAELRAASNQHRPKQDEPDDRFSGPDSVVEFGNAQGFVPPLSEEESVALYGLFKGSDWTGDDELTLRHDIMMSDLKEGVDDRPTQLRGLLDVMRKVVTQEEIAVPPKTTQQTDWITPRPGGI